LSKKYRILLALFKRRGNKKQIQILNQINMKQLFLILALAFSLNAYSQDIKNVTLVVSGQGKTQEEAKQNALRSAIEQAFGTFISSKTEILNDDIVKDEIVSVANGSIQNFEIISETQIPNDGYSSSLKATVSVTKLTSYVESKGIAIEFKGGIFAANMRQKTLMEEAEYKAVLNLCDVSWKILSSSIEFELELAKEPILISKENQKYGLGILIKAKSNANKEMFNNYFGQILTKLSISEEDLVSYESSKIPTYRLKLLPLNESISLRNPKSLVALKNLILWSNKFYFDFKVVSNIDTFGIYSPYNVENNLYHVEEIDDFKPNIFYLYANPFNPIYSRTYGRGTSLIHTELIKQYNNAYCPTSVALALFGAISVTRPEIAKEATQLSNIWDLKLEHNCFNIDCDHFVWYEGGNYSCDLSIDLSKEPIIDIYIFKELTLSQLSELTGYSILKSPFSF
jgi:hypothetical protein